MSTFYFGLKKSQKVLRWLFSGMLTGELLAVIAKCWLFG